MIPLKRPKISKTYANRSDAVTELYNQPDTSLTFTQQILIIL